MYKILSFFLFLFLALSLRYSFAETISVAPKGEAYKSIDLTTIYNSMQVFSKGSDAQKDELVSRILQKPGNYSPLELFSMSAYLLKKGKIAEAIFWYMAADLRVRYDANRCADKTARQGAYILENNFTRNISNYIFEDIDKSEKIVNEVEKWDKETPYNYEHRWINFHGMNAMLDGLDKDSKQSAALSLPEAEWDSIAAKNRQDFVNAFKAILNKEIVLIRESGKGNLEKIESLLKSGVFIESTDNLGNTPLMAAAANGQLGAVKLLIKSGANVGAKNKIGNTVFMQAVSARQIEAARVLLENGAQVNSADRNGITPLMSAALSGQPEMIKFLLNAGADPMLKSNAGLTASEYTISEEIKDLLRIKKQ